MNEKDISVDELIADIYECLEEHPTEVIPSAEDSQPPRKKTSPARKILTVVCTVLILLLETVLLLAGGLYGVMYVLAKGPSPTARNIFVMSVRETSAVGFLANLFFTEEEIAQFTAGDTTVDYDETDTSLIQIPKPTTKPEDGNDGPTPDAWGLIDEDGDGIILQEVRGEGYSGYMMVVLDPSRVIMGSVPSSYGGRGYTVEKFVERYDAVAGINAGGFYDPDGKGNGSIPDTMVVYEGTVYYPEYGSGDGFAALDRRHILHVGTFTTEDIRNKDIQYGVGFGPVLVVNGEIANRDSLSSGVNPRTAIGQRSDGAMLMLVIDGRQVTSLGATFLDLAEVMLSYGAVNACNLDGGSSSMMWYNGEYINNCASVVGVRPIPTCFLVLKEGQNG